MKVFKAFTIATAILCSIFGSCGDDGDEPTMPESKESNNVNDNDEKILSEMKRNIIGIWAHTGTWSKGESLNKYDSSGFPIMDGTTYKKIDPIDRFFIFYTDGKCEEYRGDQIDESGNYHWMGNKIKILGYGGPDPIRFINRNKMQIHWAHDGWDVYEFERVNRIN